MLDKLVYKSHSITASNAKDQGITNVLFIIQNEKLRGCTSDKMKEVPNVLQFKE